MPRGIYDRSKTKAQRATSNAKTAPKRKYTRKSDTKFSVAVANSPVGTGLDYDDTYLLSEVRQTLMVLTEVREKFGTAISLESEVAAHIEIISSLREKMFASKSAATEVAESEIEEEDTPNGVAQTHQVPLPPPPVPVMPSR